MVQTMVKISATLRTQDRWTYPAISSPSVVLIGCFTVGTDEQKYSNSIRVEVCGFRRIKWNFRRTKEKCSSRPVAALVNNRKMTSQPYRKELVWNSRKQALFKLNVYTPLALICSKISPQVVVLNISALVSQHHIIFFFSESQRGQLAQATVCLITVQP